MLYAVIARIGNRSISRKVGKKLLDTVAEAVRLTCCSDIFEAADESVRFICGTAFASNAEELDRKDEREDIAIRLCFG